MDNYLIEHVLNNHWCSPRKANQWVWEPNRVSTTEGYLNYANLLGTMVELPVRRRYFQLFHVGGLDPEFLGLVRQHPSWADGKWFKISDVMKEQGLEVTIYNDNGVNWPRTDAWYIVSEGCLFFAIPEDKRIRMNPVKDRVFFRFYSNPAMGRYGDTQRYFMNVGRYEPLNTTNILAVEAEMAVLAAQPGKIRYYINGLLSTSFDLGNVQIGDVLEYVQDTSIFKTLRWKIADLFNYPSELDGNYKYLLHYEGDNDFNIDYQNDLDVHVVIQRERQFDRGVYFNRNHAKSHRQVTHKDYGIDSQVVNLLRDNLSALMGLTSTDEFEAVVEVDFRYAKTDRTLGFENNRIRELYKLDDAIVVKSLNGWNATMPEWYCANLEKSASIGLMSEVWLEVGSKCVETGYGYNAISKILGDTPTKSFASGGQQVVNLPRGLQTNSTMYEYDQNGLLLGWHYHLAGMEYRAKNPLTRLVEGVYGEGDFTAANYYGQTNIPVLQDRDFRVYRCYLREGVPDNQWEEITGRSDYEVVNNKLIYKLPGNEHWLCVRNDSKFLAYDYEVEHSSGLLNLVISENPTGNPMDEMEAVAIPFAQLDLWMNSYKLIRGLDYYVKWPQVIITNKTYLLRGDLSNKQKFHIRASRLATNMELDKVDDVGWIYHGSLSNNFTYDVRDDRVMQINVGGRTMHREDLVFAEDKPLPSVINDLNGFPYQINDLIIPFQNYTDKSGYEMRPLSQAIDKRVSDFLTEHYGSMEPEGVSSVGPRYPLVSPFFSHICYLLVNKMIEIPTDRVMMDFEIREKVKIHEWLLDYDPIKDGHQPDIQFAFVVPHASPEVQVMDFIDYRFMKRVIELYGYNGVVYGDYIAIKK